MFLCLPFFKKYRVSFSKISFLPSLLSLSHILQTYVVLGLPTVQQARGRLLRRKPRGIAVKTQIWYDVVSWGSPGLRGIIINHQNHRYICFFVYCALILVYWLVETPFFSQERGAGVKVATVPYPLCQNVLLFQGDMLFTLLFYILLVDRKGVFVYCRPNTLILSWTQRRIILTFKLCCDPLNSKTVNTPRKFFTKTLTWRLNLRCAQISQMWNLLRHFFRTKKF